MGAIGGRLSDLAVVTSDNPRSEDPEAIVAEISRGIGRRGAGLEVERRPPRGDRPGAGRGRAGRHRRHRRQGARAGTGIRGRPQDPVRRPRRRPRGAAGGWPAAGRVIELGAGADRRRDRARRSSARRADGRPARRDRLPQGRHPGDSSSACTGSAPTAASSPTRRSRPGRGGWCVDPRPRAELAEGSSRAGGCSSPRTRWRRCRRWPAPGDASSAARVVGITGSVGKTSVKDISRALLPGRVHANPENLNTEIGLPLTILEAPAGDRDPGPARWRCGARADRRAVRRWPSPTSPRSPTSARSTSSCSGTVEAIAEAKAEILDGLRRRPAPRSPRPTPRRWSRISPERS